VTRRRIGNSTGAAHDRAARLRDDPETRAYADRRSSQGKSARDIRRWLKRAVAQQLFEFLERHDRSAVEVICA
jgi:hypothetical protein